MRFASAALLISFLVPISVFADVANVVFTTESQTVQQGTPSGQLTLQAQDSGGSSVNIPSTACLAFSSTSAAGQFSSSATTWNPVTVLTMNKNTANKNFYYEDSAAGVQTITVKIALKPDSVSSSCASWSQDEWSVQWTATQTITIGSGSATPLDTGANTSTTTSDTGSHTQTSTTVTPTSSYVAPPTPDLYTDAGADRTVIVGADAEFDARAYDKNRTVLDAANIRFSWNFGDGATAEGSTVLHHFDYPGKYAVTVNIAQQQNAASDEVIVTAEPAKLSFATLPDGGVEIQNLAGRDLDLSDWIIRSGASDIAARFMLPPHTIVLSGASMHISHVTLGFAAGTEAELQYPNGVKALGAGETTAPTLVSAAAAPAASPVPALPVLKTAPSSPRAVTYTSHTDEVDTDQPPVTEDASSTIVAAAAAAPASNFWWVAAVALALAAGGALVIAKNMSKAEWKIEE